MTRGLSDSASSRFAAVVSSSDLRRAVSPQVDVASASVRGVLLVGHGTRDRRGTEEFFRLGEELQRTLGQTPVAPCLLEFQRPTIAEAWQTLIALGVDEVVVAPLLLFAAGHAKQDIPDAVARCRESTPGVRVRQTRPLSRHPAMMRRIGERLDQSFERTCLPRHRVGVVMVGRGSHDPCAQADMRVLSEVAMWRRGFAGVRTAFYAMAEPRLPEVLDEIATSGDCDAVVVQPHLLFAGRLFEAISRQTDEASRRHPGIRWIVSDYLGPDRQVAEAIAGRISETAGRCR